MSVNPVVIILAGGASSRMWPMREKSLLRFGDAPLLQFQLERYATLGIEQVVIVGNPTNQTIMQDIISNCSHLSINIQLAIQPEPIGQGDAILQTQSYLSHDATTPLFVTQVHDVVDDDLYRSMLNQFRAKPNATYLAGMEMKEYFPGGYLIVGDENKITGIIEKPGAGNEPSNLVNIVVHIHERADRLFAALQSEYESDQTTDDHYERAMGKLMAEHEYFVVPYRGQWNALKYPWHVLDIMETFLTQIDGQQIADDAYIAPSASLVGDVYIGAGAKVFPGAAVVGPAYVGAGTIVGNNALIRHSMVLDHCTVGFTTEVARSYVADHCDMHACRVLDSVFAPYVNFSAGCTTANLRIDRGDVPTYIKGEKINSGRDKFGAVIGQGAFLGVDVMTMPGVKIGANTEVGPGTHVLRDLPDNKRIYVVQATEIVDKG